MYELCRLSIRFANTSLIKTTSQRSTIQQNCFTHAIHLATPRGPAVSSISSFRVYQWIVDLIAAIDIPETCTSRHNHERKNQTHVRESRSISHTFRRKKIRMRRREPSNHKLKLPLFPAETVMKRSQIFSFDDSFSRKMQLVVSRSMSPGTGFWRSPRCSCGHVFEKLPGIHHSNIASWKIKPK